MMFSHYVFFCRSTFSEVQTVSGFVVKDPGATQSAAKTSFNILKNNQSH